MKSLPVQPHPASSKPVLAVDFDDTIVTYVERLIEEYNKEFEARLNPKNTYLPGEFGSSAYGWRHDADQAQAWINDYLARPESLATAPIAGAVAALESLSEHYEVCVVTGRSPDIDHLMKQWLERYMPGAIERLYHTGRTPKSVICKEIGAVWLIDDNPAYLANVMAAGVGGILFGNYPWHTTHEIPAGAKIAKDWDEVTELLLP